MKKEYTKVTTLSGQTIIQYEENKILYSIPVDPANSDYQTYLASLEENNK